MRKLSAFSYLLMALGAVLLFQGARLYMESRMGQVQASEQFEERVSLPAVTPQVAAPPPLKPHDGETFAKLIIPRLDTELYVIEGDGAADLRRGPGHLPGTAMPGDNGNCVIAGHRDTHFRVLKDLKKGDDIVLETSRGQFLYRVEAMRVVAPTYTAPLRPTTDAELHLVTCYPFYYVGSAPKRFVVRAQLAGAVAGTS